MTRQIWNIWMIIFLIVGPNGARAFKGRRNVLLLVVDDLRPALGAYGDPLTYARELILEKNLERLVTYHFEIPMTCEFQKCKNRNQGTSSCEVSVPQFFGHKIKISLILPKLVPNNTYGVPKLPIKL